LKTKINILPMLCKSTIFVFILMLQFWYKIISNNLNNELMLFIFKYRLGTFDKRKFEFIEEGTLIRIDFGLDFYATQLF